MRSLPVFPVVRYKDSKSIRRGFQSSLHQDSKSVRRGFQSSLQHDFMPSSGQDYVKET